MLTKMLDFKLLVAWFTIDKQETFSCLSSTARAPVTLDSRKASFRTVRYQEEDGAPVRQRPSVPAENVRHGLAGQTVEMAESTPLACN